MLTDDKGNVGMTEEADGGRKILKVSQGNWGTYDVLPNGAPWTAMHKRTVISSRDQGKRLEISAVFVRELLLRPA